MITLSFQRHCRGIIQNETKQKTKASTVGSRGQTTVIMPTAQYNHVRLNEQFLQIASDLDLSFIYIYIHLYSPFMVEAK